MNLVKILAYVAYYEMIVDFINAVKDARNGRPFAFNGSYKVDGKRKFISFSGSVTDE